MQKRIQRQIDEHLDKKGKGLGFFISNSMAGGKFQLTRIGELLSLDISRNKLNDLFEIRDIIFLSFEAIKRAAVEIVTTQGRDIPPKGE